MTDHILPGTIAVEIETGEKGESLTGVPTYRLQLDSIFSLAHALRCSPEPKKTARELVSERERAPRRDGFSRGRIAYSLSAKHADINRRSGAAYSIGVGRGCSGRVKQRGPKEESQSGRR